MLDGVENTEKKCELVRFYFKRKEEGFGGAEFVLSEDVRAFCLSENAFFEENVSVGLARFCVGDIFQTSRPLAWGPSQRKLYQLSGSMTHWVTDAILVRVRGSVV